MIFIMIFIVDGYHLIPFFLPTLEIYMIISAISIVVFVLVMSKVRGRIWSK